MPGNVNIISGGETQYVKIEPKKYASASGDVWGVFENIYPNIFYDIGSLDIVNLTEKGTISNAYQEYMFEFTALSDSTTLKLTSEKTLYWPVVPEIAAGHKYQISSFNGIVLFAEVATE